MDEMTFTNSNNNNSEGKFSKTFSSSLGSPASTSSTSGSSFGTNAGTSTKPSTFTAGTGSTLSSVAAKPAGFGGATASAASQFASGKTSVPSASSAFSSTAQSKTVPLTSVSSATAARPAALSPSPVPPAPASASTASAAGSSMARPSTLGTAPNASATSAATATTARPSAFTVTSTTAARPSAFGTTAQLSSSAGAATRPSAFTSSMAATASTASTSATRTSSFTSTVSTAARPSAFTSTTATSSSGVFGARSLSPVSNDEFAKKFAETKAALSTAKRASLTSSSSDAGNAPAVAAGQEVTDVQYRRFAAFIEEKCGIVLGVGKQYLVNSRLSSLLSKFGISNVDELINKAMENTPNNKIQEAVIDAMTTNETLWFRDTYPYTALEQFILPELAKKGKYPVRIWSAACSSGQEPYSIGIVVQEQMAKMLHIDPKQTQIIGTDLSPEMLATCKLGQYDVHALSRGLSAERKSKFFKPTRNPNIMQIDPRVKSMVEFRPMNLLGSYALMGKFDVIFCRNVLIYFSNDVKAEILRKLTMCLNPGGYLILGSTETLVGVADKYEMVRHSPGILYRLKPQKFAF